jgi:hypothetical protein
MEVQGENIRFNIDDAASGNVSVLCGVGAAIQQAFSVFEQCRECHRDYCCN